MQLLIHADVGTDYPASKVVSLGYVITDQNGRMVDSKAADMRLLPVMSGVPSPLQYTAGASLPPGDYTLKLAVGRRRARRHGRAHHSRDAAERRRAHAQRADGRRPDRRRRTADARRSAIRSRSAPCTATSRPTAPNADGMTMEYEVAASADAPALLNVDVPPRPAGDSRVDLHQSDADARSCRPASTCCARFCRATASRSRR